jgi:hypothetical protein
MTLSLPYGLLNPPVGPSALLTLLVLHPAVKENGGKDTKVRVCVCERGRGVRQRVEERGEIEKVGEEREESQRKGYERE